MKLYLSGYYHPWLRQTLFAAAFALAPIAGTAAAQQLKLTPDDVKFYQKWMNLTGTCAVPISGVQDDAFRKCAASIIGTRVNSDTPESRLEYVVYSNIKSELTAFEDNIKSIRQKILSGYSGDRYLEALFYRDASQAPKGVYDKIISYFFLGATPIVSVTPIFTYDVAFYNPYLDIVYFMNFRKENGAYVPQEGFFAYGSIVREGHPPEAAPSWLMSNDNISAMPEIVMQTIEGIGRTNLVIKNRKSAIKGNDTAGVYARIFAFIKTLRTQTDCSKRLVREFNENPLGVSKNAKNTNITPDDTKIDKLDFQVVISVIDKKNNETAFLASRNSPSQLISITNGNLYCQADRINYVDALESFYKAAAKLAVTAENEKNQNK